MAIIYTYPIVQPTVDDLIIGTDVGSSNATKSFSVQSLVSIINAAAGSGTVTSVGISNSDSFLTVTDSPVIDAGVIDIKLSALGTPSSSTFLRGDNTWAEACESSNVAVVYDQDIITPALTSMEFSQHFRVSSMGVGSVFVDLNPTSLSSVYGIAQGPGIGVTSSFGVFTISNTGVRSITAGPGIQIEPDPNDGTGNLTIRSTGDESGVGSVIPGRGLEMINGTIVSNPEIGINLTSTNNYIVSGATVAGASSADSIAFNDSSDGDVKITTLATIPVTSLDFVKTYIDAGDADDITNATDKGATADAVPPVQNVVTLTTAQYTALGVAGQQGNTLYLTVASAATTFTITLNPINVNLTGLGTATGSEFTLTGDTLNTTKDVAENGTYAFNTGISVVGAFFFCDANGDPEPPTISNASGIATANASVATNISGWIKDIAVETVTVIPELNYSQVVGATNGIVSFPTNPGAVSGPSPFTLPSTEWSSTYSIANVDFKDGFESLNLAFTGPGVNATQTYTASATAPIIATGDVTPISNTLIISVGNTSISGETAQFASAVTIATGQIPIVVIGATITTYTFTGLTQNDPITITVSALITNTNQYEWTPAPTQAGDPIFSVVPGAGGAKTNENTFVFERTPDFAGSVTPGTVIYGVGVDGEIVLKSTQISISVNIDNISPIGGISAGEGFSMYYEYSLSGAAYVTLGTRNSTLGFSSFSQSGTPLTTTQYRGTLTLDPGYRWTTTPDPIITFFPVSTGSPTIPTATFPLAGTQTVFSYAAICGNPTDPLIPCSDRVAAGIELIPATVAFMSSYPSYNTEQLACAALTPSRTTLYIVPGINKTQPTSNIPEAGDLISTTAGGTTPVVGGTTTSWAIYENTPFTKFFAYQVDVNGIVQVSAGVACN
jgi:hypothetical protein